MTAHVLKSTLAATALAGALALGGTETQAQSKILRAETGSPGNASHISTTVMSKIWNRELGTSVQINDSQTLTRSALKLGRGEIEIMPFPTAIYAFLSQGSKMYGKNLKEEAIAASKNVRSILGWPAVLFHPITFADTGITKFEQIKGKRVFTGPPSGAAAVTAEDMIRALTGYEPNEDYNAIRLPWGGGTQAMLDGKLDVFVRPAGLGAAFIEQIGFKQKFRLLDAGGSVDSQAWEEFLKVPGRVTGVIPAGTYKEAQVNSDEDIRVSASTFQFAVNRELPEDMVYQMTKLVWDNIEEIHQTASDLKTMNPKKPFVGVNMPLHAGAMRYYREQGFDIPDHLVAPES